MCGIAGLLSLSSSQQQFENLIQRMQSQLRHRGPDDEGIYISSDRQAAIVHTRLSILDLSSAGHQPMSVADERYWITFNGEIYNFQELRSTLISQGEQFHSQTDTEVILKLYQRLGTDCVHQLRGMFAFAIWDDREKTCFLARDPLGIKPLYYWNVGSTLLFASELRAILATRLPTINLSMEGLYGYLVSGSVPEPHTLIEGIHCLPGGHWLRWQSGNVTQNQYWQINFTPEAIEPSEAAQKVRDALLDSIKHHFVSDVSVGIFLSGGIDSTAVVALASQTQINQLRTYSIAFEEPDWNEGEISSKVAEKFGTDHTEYKITASLGRELFPQYLAAIDQPSIDGFNTFCVSQIAHKDGTKVVLSGLGGDELFGGYKSFQKVPQMVRCSQRLQVIHPIRTGVGIGLERWGNSPKVKRLGDFLQQTPNSATAYRSFRGIFSHREACAIAKQYLPDRALPMRSQNNPFSDLPSLEDEVSLLEISGYMRNQLLRDSDVMSMAWGLELRVPLVDQVLLEAISSIPSSIRLAPGKQLLIQAVPELPSWVVNRPKRGFSFPFEQWIAGEWRDHFPELNRHNDISLKPWYRRWSLSLLQHWWEEVSE
ncbi:MAG TPA: asparagine synthase (glutamine-hydrolyzing) [Coleofasciculaceae cyanobacterium]|jgi:asparagine synthase (glutamine-hydrolysing)